MTRRRSDYADEAADRINAIGLTEDVIAANENAPTVAGVYAELGMHRPLQVEDIPGKLSTLEIIERGNAEGYCDVRLGRPQSAAIRFMEQRLHYENFEAFASFVEAYERAWKAGAK